MLKLVKPKMLVHIQQRVDVEIPESGHFIHGGNVEKPIEFIAYISNPTPIEITLVSREITILYQYVPIAEERNYKQIHIPRESKKFKITLAIYNPFLYPIGLPSKNKEWRLKGVLGLRCYYGDWEYTFDYTQPVSVQGDWQQARQQFSQVRHELMD